MEMGMGMRMGIGDGGGDNVDDDMDGDCISLWNRYLLEALRVYQQPSHHECPGVQRCRAFQVTDTAAVFMAVVMVMVIIAWGR